MKDGNESKQKSKFNEMSGGINSEYPSQRIELESAALIGDADSNLRKIIHTNKSLKEISRDGSNEAFGEEDSNMRAMLDR